MKKLTVGLALILSGFAANSLAALPTGSSSRCDVSVPSYCGGFTFGLTGLYWRASSPQLDFGASFPSLTVDGDPLFNNGNHRHLDHDYDWGFKANIGYIFPCSGNDVNLTYTHWDNDDRHHHDNNSGFFLPDSALFTDGLASVPFATIAVLGTAFDTTIGLAFDLPISIPFDPTDVVGVSARSNFENHTWDLDFGQSINVGCNFKLRWFGGLRYSRLEHDLDTTVDLAETATGVVLAPVDVVATLTPTTVGVTAVLPVTVTADIAATIRDIVHTKSEFDGIGPRFGFDASYHLGGGFGVVGSLSTALLVGEHEATYSERIETAGTVTIPTLADIAIGVGVTSLGIPVIDAVVTAPLAPIVVEPTDPLETISFRHPDETRVVPNIDAKLGLDWTYQFCNCSHSKLTIEAGYLVSHYFNAIDKVSGAGAFAPQFGSRHTLDASFDGPYVGVQVAL